MQALPGTRQHPLMGKWSMKSKRGGSGNPLLAQMPCSRGLARSSAPQPRDTPWPPWRGPDRCLVPRAEEGLCVREAAMLEAMRAVGACGELCGTLDGGADKKLFEVKRKDQMNALKNLIELNDVNQQYKIIDIMLKGLFKVLEDSRAVLIAADVPPDGPFPQEEKLKDAYSHVVENTAFFGDVVLRFPKIVHHYFDRNSNWNNLIRWGIGFCNLTGVFEQGPHSQVLGLFFPSADAFQKALREEEKRRKKEEKRKEIRKGPRISRSQSDL
ncbi:coiled-coil domain-containing protein 134 isoform X2 [Apteryx mantelli]|uniref:Coiled-coil domain-containing protein 134 isoform X2 n=1 Tax=Apteryx mantelli TaxID=2696672 RepID=A0A8B7J0Q8_9AVES|nr:PREDICTED: coiled-coil domain-containing protein 134 isoform X2 [Apteryx mantelli mantelli]